MNELNDREETNDWNRHIIEEFRANGGRVGGMFEGAPILLLHTKGARTGAHRVNPVMYLADSDQLVIFGSANGSTRNPDWYHNLLADPNVEVELGTQRFAAVARVLGGEERDRLFAIQVSHLPQFAGYQASAGRRVIPAIALVRAPA